MKRPIASLFVLALVSVTLGACTKIGTSSVPGTRHSYTTRHVLRFSTATDIEHLVTLESASAYEMYLAAMCNAWLIKTDAGGNATVPELITEIPTQQNGGISKDGKTITWHLRHNVKWSDGAPFDADDVIFSTKQVLNPANNVESTDGWDLITKMDEPDKYTVVYHLKKPYSSFGVTFFSTGGANPSVLPQHLLKGYPNLNNIPYNSLPVGIGPFKFVRWTRGDSVVMVRNPYYFRGAPKLDRVIFKIIPDRNTVLEQLRTHELDLWIEIPPHFYTQATVIPGTASIAIPSYTFDHLDFNFTNPILADRVVREALRYATNRDEIIAKAQNGLYLRSESPVTPANRYYLNLPLVPFDLAKANALLDGDGWKRGPDGIRAKGGRRLSLTLTSSIGSPDLDTEIELIRGMWKQVGVDFVVKRYLSSQYFATIANGGILNGGKFDVAIFGWGSDPNEDMSNLYACYRFPPNGQNDIRWCNPAATAAMDRAKESYDPAVRKVALAQVQRAVYDDVPTVIRDVRKLLAVYSDDLHGWHPNSVGPFDDIMKVDI
jgi:peptide/nickel transport system substrate-binding protein